MSGFGTAEPAVSMSEAQAYIRIETGEEEALLAGLIRSASALCESFLGQIIIERPFVQVLPPGAAWQRLALSPVRAISTVEAIDESGTAVPLPTTGST